MAVLLGPIERLAAVLSAAVCPVNMLGVISCAMLIIGGGYMAVGAAGGGGHLRMLGCTLCAETAATADLCWPAGYRAYGG